MVVFQGLEESHSEAMHGDDMAGPKSLLFNSFLRKASFGSAAIGLLYLAIILIREPLTLADFRYIWLAGELWSLNLDPYGAAFNGPVGNYILYLARHLRHKAPTGSNRRERQHYRPHLPQRREGLGSYRSLALA